MKPCVYGLWSWVRTEVPDFLLSVVFFVGGFLIDAVFVIFIVAQFVAIGFLSWAIANKLVSLYS